MAESGSENPHWNRDTKRALGLSRTIGHTLGILSFDKNNSSSGLRFFFVLILLLIMNYNLIREFVSGCISIFEIVDFIGLLAANTVCILKVFMIRFHDKKMFCLVNSAINDWSYVRDDESRDVMRKYANFATFASVFQLTVAYLAAGLIVIGALPTIWIGEASPMNNVSATTVRNLPMSTGCSMIDAPTAVYLGFYLLQFIQLLCLCCCNFGCDTIFLSISMHLSAQYELLKRDVSQLGDDNVVDEGEIKKKFATLIQRHNHLTSLANFLEDVFHLIMLGQLVASGLHISLLGIQMLFALRDHFYTMLVYTPTGISLLLLQLCMYSYVGDDLSSQATGMCYAAYSCSWYNFSPSVARDVLFVMMRSKSTFNLTAGKVFRMNFEGFTYIIKTMMSFFSVIKITIIGR